MKLELKHLAPYLPYGLKAEMLDYKIDYVGKQYDEIIGFHEWSKKKDWCCLTAGGSKPSFDRIKPILRPLSDLTKEIEVNGERFVPQKKMPYLDFDWLITSVKPQELVMKSNYEDILKLLEWHFDIYSLIENGLAIDINTLKE